MLDYLLGRSNVFGRLPSHLQPQSSGGAIGRSTSIYLEVFQLLYQMLLTLFELFFSSLLYLRLLPTAALKEGGFDVQMDG